VKRWPRFVATAALILFIGVPSIATSAEPRIAVYVTDKTSGAALSDAQVSVLGPEAIANRVGRTDEFGRFAVDGLPAGVYRIFVRQPNYADAQTTVGLEDEGAVRVAIALVRELPKIGSVTARERSEATVARLDAKSPASRISRDLFDALSQLGGVELAMRPNGQIAGISIAGRDPSATAYTFDGFRVPNPFNSSFDPGLVDAVQVDSQRETVAFLSVNPTESPTYTWTNTLGGYGYKTERFTAQGTDGSLGYAFVTSLRAAESALDHRTYLDITGDSYEHRGASSGQSFYVALTAPLGTATTATVRGSRLQLTSQPLPAYLFSSIPAGVGPDAIAHARAKNLSVTIGTSNRLGIVTVSASEGFQNSNEEEPRLALEGVSSPSRSIGSSWNHMLSVDIALLDSAATHIDFNVQSNRIASSELTATGSSAESLQLVSRDFSLSRVLLKSRALTIPLRVTAANSNDSAALAGLRVDPQFAIGSRVRARLGFGTDARPASGLAGGLFGDPGNASYDCSAKAITVSGPNEPGATIRAAGTDVSAETAFPHSSIALYAYDKTYRGISLSSALVPSTAMTSLPPGFVAALQEQYDRVGGCQGSPPPPSQVFVVHDISNLSVRSKGYELRGKLTVGANTEIAWFYETDSSVLPRSDPRLTSAASPYIPNSQLPSVPLHRLGITAASRAGVRTSVVASAVWTASNNANNLPPYLQVSAGVERRLSPSVQLSIVANNLTRAYDDLFSSTKYAVPLATLSRPLVLNAVPLRQPQIFARLTARTGR